MGSSGELCPPCPWRGEKHRSLSLRQDYSCSPGARASNGTGSPSKTHTRSPRTWFDTDICTALPCPCHPREPSGHSEQRPQPGEQQSHLDLKGGHWQGWLWTLHLSLPLPPPSGAGGPRSRSLPAEQEQQVALTTSPWLGGDTEQRLGRESPPEHRACSGTAKGRAGGERSLSSEVAPAAAVLVVGRDATQEWAPPAFSTLSRMYPGSRRGFVRPDIGSLNFSVILSAPKAAVPRGTALPQDAAR